MGALKNRDFIYKGLQFHLNDAKYHNEFTPKYLLMFWNDSFGYLIVHKTKRHADACLFFQSEPGSDFLSKKFTQFFNLRG